jgi:GAF domain-containing protein
MNTLVHQLAEFAQALTAAEDFDDTAEQLIVYAVQAVGADSGGITMLRGRGRLETFGATSPVVVEVDAAQYALQEGPCVDAATDSTLVVSGCLATDARWPRWGPCAASAGMGSVLSAEMHGREGRIGALNLYGERESAFSDDDAELAGVLAAQAAALMAVMSSEEGLRSAMETRTLIGQAQGMLMERFDIDAQRAFSVLSRFSQQANVKLRDISADLVRSRRIP